MINFKINGKQHSLDIDPDTPLLWAIRENVGLTGTKFGCGISQCGACTVHLNGVPVRSCIIPVAAADGAEITTIEGIADESGLHPIQQAWIDEQVPQCGYCQSGQIMSAVALLRDKPDPTDADIDSAMSGNVCRCGMYARIKRGIKRVAADSKAMVSIYNPTNGEAKESDPATGITEEVQHG
ncbi:MAG: (2Fe-2S)-binding protein [Pseudomonadales bacterium]|nr:(2Fe-2S)-binding protein [Pseudomonadales bacterium]